MHYLLINKYRIHYFFCFVVVEIEFSSQAVMIPLTADVPPKEDTISELINTGDIGREQRVYEEFKGSVIPPSMISQSDKGNSKYIYKTALLRRIQVLHPESKEYRTLYCQSGEFSCPCNYLFSENAEMIYKRQRIRWVSIHQAKGRFLSLDRVSPKICIGI